MYVSICFVCLWHFFWWSIFILKRVGDWFSKNNKFTIIFFNFAFRIQKIIDCQKQIFKRYLCLLNNKITWNNSKLKIIFNYWVQVIYCVFSFKKYFQTFVRKSRGFYNLQRNLFEYVHVYLFLLIFCV